MLQAHAYAPIRHRAWDMGALMSVPKPPAAVRALLFDASLPLQMKTGYEGEAGQKLTASKWDRTEAPAHTSDSHQQTRTVTQQPHDSIHHIAQGTAIRRNRLERWEGPYFSYWETEGWGPLRPHYTQRKEGSWCLAHGLLAGVRSPLLNLT